MIFEEAVIKATALIDDMDTLQNESEKLSAYVQEYFEKDDKTKIELLLLNAKSDAEVFDALAIYASKALENGKPLGSSISSWVAGCLMQEVTRPPTSKKYLRGNPNDRTERDVLIFFAVEWLVANAGFNRYRNETTDSICAISIVAEALKRKAEKPSSYEGVRTVYEKIRKEFGGGFEPWIGAAVPTWVLLNG